VTLIEGRDVFVHIVDLSGKVTEAVTENEDGTYTIFIDAQLAPEAQRARYEHAMRHIRSNDFEKSDVQTIEAAAHKALEEGRMPIPANIYEREIRRLRRERRRIEKQLAELQTAREQLARVEPDLYGTLFEIAELPNRWRD